MKKLFVTTPSFLNLLNPVSDSYVLDLSLMDSHINDEYFSNKRGDNTLIINFPRIIGNTIDYDCLDDYITHVKLLQPEIVILPSLLERCEKTNEIISYWKEHAPSTITAGTIEATSYEQILTSYNFLKNNVDIIVFNTLFFNSNEIFQENINTDLGLAYSKSREKIIDYLISQEVFDTNKQHYLVSLGSPSDLNLIKTRNYITGVLTRLPSWYSIRGETMSNTTSIFQYDIGMDYLMKRDDNDEDSAILERINNSVDYLRQAIEP